MCLESRYVFSKSKECIELLGYHIIKLLCVILTKARLECAFIIRFLYTVSTEYFVREYMEKIRDKFLEFATCMLHNSAFYFDREHGPILSMLDAKTSIDRTILNDLTFPFDVVNERNNCPHLLQLFHICVPGKCFRNNDYKIRYGLRDPINRIVYFANMRTIFHILFCVFLE